MRLLIQSEEIMRNGWTDSSAVLKSANASIVYASIKECVANHIGVPALVVIYTALTLQQRSIHVSTLESILKNGLSFDGSSLSHELARILDQLTNVHILLVSGFAFLIDVGGSAILTDIKAITYGWVDVPCRSMVAYGTKMDLLGVRSLVLWCEIIATSVHLVHCLEGDCVKFGCLNITIAYDLIFTELDLALVPRFLVHPGGCLSVECSSLSSAWKSKTILPKPEGRILGVRKLWKDPIVHVRSTAVDLTGSIADWLWQDGFPILHELVLDQSTLRAPGYGSDGASILPICIRCIILIYLWKLSVSSIDLVTFTRPRIREERLLLSTHGWRVNMRLNLLYTFDRRRTRNLIKDGAWFGLRVGLLVH